MEKRFIFKIKAGYYCKLLTSETLKSLGNTKNEIAKYNQIENVRHLEINEAVLAHYNIANNDYQRDLRVLYAFIANKLYGELLDISSKRFIFLKTFHSESFHLLKYCLPIKILNH